MLHMFGDELDGSVEVHRQIETLVVDGRQVQIVRYCFRVMVEFVSFSTAQDCLDAVSLLVYVSNVEAA